MQVVKHYLAKELLAIIRDFTDLENVTILGKFQKPTVPCEFFTSLGPPFARRSKDTRFCKT
ncbi:hypothetical protein DMC01_11975 [Campylobacter troglodytis]|nr:hypothetical protein DMC01_11975 [Campylobacter troglodytis]